MTDIAQPERAPDQIELAEKETNVPTPRDAGYWATKVDRLAVDPERARAGFNIAGKRLTGPQQGFGRLRQRTYTVEVGPDVTPQQVISAWKADFGSFWPKGNVFQGALTGITPGDVAPIAVNAAAGIKLSTGVFVLYSDDVSFTFMTPQGHMFASWITFAAERRESGTVVQALLLLRTSDPLFEFAFPIMKVMEDRFWKQTLANVARSVGVAEPMVTEQTTIVDRRRIWKNWRNVWHNAGIRSMLHLLAAPVLALRRRGRA